MKAQRQSIIPDADINPLLPADLATRCQKLYTDLSGSTTEIAELKAAPQTLESMKNLQLPDEISALSFISSLNAAGYEQYGNPYFNQNPYSIQIKLNGHHFLHWLHPKLMAQFIANYLVQSEKINPA
ncbi:hypothetical protein MOO45_03970 [Bombilactobacillus folatiphilus]|uniref:Uncharacterized protein n=1 Tax=Bombilactobacillus folatiphilus TaxID=2923362 RepID=A0ABY4PAV6_9LACO|nr:hypothetical protein [Bombilactobacillus folatiphilus]UQS82808.1 hypothetical protein MOO45_03970 [Bombilactobacillus folatiphilus]